MKLRGFFGGTLCKTDRRCLILFRQDYYHRHVAGNLLCGRDGKKESACITISISSMSTGLHDVQKLAEPLKKKGRNYPGFNLFQQKDFDFILALVRGKGFISGFTNKTIRRVLKDKTGPQVSRLLKRMRVHGLIRKVGKTYKHYLTPLGRRALLTALKLRELVVIPSLAGVLAA